MKPRHLLLSLLLTLPLPLAQAGAADATHPDDRETTWTHGTGLWTDPEKWSAGLPTPFLEASVEGDSTVSIPPGSYEAALLEVGNRAGGHATIQLDGGQLLIRQDSLRIGEYTGSSGTFILNSGQMHCVMDVFVGAVTATTRRANKSALLINGGTFLGLTLTAGCGLGAESLVAIKGSIPPAIHALEFVSLTATADPAGTPAQTTPLLHHR